MSCGNNNYDPFLAIRVEMSWKKASRHKTHHGSDVNVAIKEVLNWLHFTELANRDTVCLVSC